MTGRFEFRVEVTHGSILEDAERQLILHVLRLCGGHQRNAADALGMGLRTLGLKVADMRRLGMQVPTYVESASNERNQSNIHRHGRFSRTVARQHPQAARDGVRASEELFE